LRSLAEVVLKWPDTREATINRETLAIAVQMEGIVTRLLGLQLDAQFAGHSMLSITVTGPIRTAEEPPN